MGEYANVLLACWQYNDLYIFLLSNLKCFLITVKSLRTLRRIILRRWHFVSFLYDPPWVQAALSANGSLACGMMSLSLWTHTQLTQNYIWTHKGTIQRKTNCESHQSFYPYMSFATPTPLIMARYHLRKYIDIICSVVYITTTYNRDFFISWWLSPTDMMLLPFVENQS